MSLLTQQNQRCSQSSWQTYLGFDRTWSLDCYFYHQQIIYWLALKTSTVDYRLIIHCLLWILCIFRDIKLEMLDLFLVSVLPGHPLQFTDRVSVMTDFYWHSLFILPPKKSVYIDGLQPVWSSDDSRFLPCWTFFYWCHYNFIPPDRKCVQTIKK